jgi:hypothetical protein
LVIECRVTAGFEPKPRIEAPRLEILLVHVRRQIRLVPESFMDKCAADACSPKFRVDEQRLHVTAIEQHESDRSIILVNGKIEGRLREERDHFRLDGTAVLRGQKVMRCVHARRQTSITRAPSAGVDLRILIMVDLV